MAALCKSIPVLFFRLKIKKGMDYDCSKLKRLIESSTFQNVMLCIIFINLVTMGIATDKKIVEKTGNMFTIIDYVFIGIYSLEILLKLIVYKFCFFTDLWNVFDLVVVIISAIPDIPNVQSLRSIRAIKAIRGFKILNRISALKLIVDVIFKSIHDIVWVFFLIIIFLYVFSLVGVNLFGNYLPEYFGTIPKAMFSLTQIMTFEGFCYDIARPLIKIKWWYSLYFIIFTLIAGFILINVMIGVICNSYDKIFEQEKKEKDINDKLDKMNEELLNVSQEMNTERFNESLDGIVSIIYAINERISQQRENIP